MKLYLHTPPGLVWADIYTPHGGHARFRVPPNLKALESYVRVIAAR